jgi:L-threonylcarbamoyladenylate synthase
LNATSVRENEALLAFGRRVLEGARVTVNLSENGDVREAAVNLFAHLHTLDVTGLPIAVMPIPLDGLGEAINDRLLRAAAKRDQS